MEKIVENMLKVPYKEPVVFLNFKKVNRNFQVPDSPETVIQKISLTRWKVHDESLSEPVKNKDNINILFSGESYIVECKFSIQNGPNDVDTTALLYYWRGEQAPKGHSPMPPGIDEYHPMDRYWQWSESAIFFKSFSHNLIVFKGSENNFDKDKLHLFMVRGELPGEIHLYELPCEKRSLRSRTSFLLVYPKRKQFVYWHGLQTNKDYTDMLNCLALHKILERFEKSWEDFSVLELQEKSENEWFLEIVKGNPSDYVSKEKTELRTEPKMFYLNSISGEFSATNIEYPLRTENTPVVAYPFLQNHLSIPGLFLLDVEADIWLWIGEPEDSSSEIQEFKKDLKLAEELAETYAQNQSNILGIPISVRYVRAGEEPLEFTNIFPTWN